MATIFSASGVPALKDETNRRTCRAKREFQRKFQRKFHRKFHRKYQRNLPPVEHQPSGKGKRRNRENSTENSTENIGAGCHQSNISNNNKKAGGRTTANRPEPSLLTHTNHSFTVHIQSVPHHPSSTLHHRLTYRHWYIFSSARSLGNSLASQSLHLRNASLYSYLRNVPAFPCFRSFFFVLFSLVRKSHPAQLNPR